MIASRTACGTILWLALSGAMAAQAPPAVAIAPLDPAMLTAHGLREVRGQHITLVTDLPPSAAIDALPGLFDQAVPQWCAYFDVPLKSVEPWRTRGYLMGDKQKFVDAGLLPDDLPPFLNGYARGLELWLYEQPGEYYRRHLFLHEGTHAFMNTFLGGGGPPWYMEGTAELMATHRLEDGEFTLHRWPRSRDDAPDLGRIKLVQDAVKNNRLPTVAEILDYGPRAHLTNEPYAMSWALCALLDGAPRYQHRFRELKKNVRRADFNELFKKSFAHDWNVLLDDWLVMAHGIDYGYDLERATLDVAPSKVRMPDGQVAIRADRGWQNTGFTVEAGHPYRITAEGQYVVADRPKPWLCEPQGVSIRYVDGHPLGIVLAGVRGDRIDLDKSPNLVEPLVVGREATFTPSQSGMLYVRINDSPAELADNSGTVGIRVEPAD